MPQDVLPITTMRGVRVGSGATAARSIISLRLIEFGSWRWDVSRTSRIQMTFLDPNQASSPDLPISALIEDWATGYALCRGLMAPVPVPDGVWLDIGRADERGRIMLSKSDPHVVQALIERTGQPGICVEIATDNNDSWVFPEHEWTVRERAFLMTARLPEVAVAATDATLPMVEVIENGRLIRAQILLRGPDPVASGMCALVGSSCVFDRIVTSEEHRRKGLATILMNSLTAAALRRGVVTGILVATSAGRELYTRLGWSDVSPITSALRI